MPLHLEASWDTDVRILAGSVETTRGGLLKAESGLYEGAGVEAELVMYAGVGVETKLGMYAGAGVEAELGMYAGAGVETELGMYAAAGFGSNAALLGDIVLEAKVGVFIIEDSVSVGSQ